MPEGNGPHALVLTDSFDGKFIRVFGPFESAELATKWGEQASELGARAAERSGRPEFNGWAGIEFRAVPFSTPAAVA